MAKKLLETDEYDPAEIGLGMAALGRPGYINVGHGIDLGNDKSVAAMYANACHILDIAWEEGVRYYDSARSYGEAENFLGSWLRERLIQPDQIVVGSKWGYKYTAKWQVEADQHEVKNHSLAMLQHQFAETKRILGGHLDLYQIHSVTPESKILTDRQVLDQLVIMRGHGLKIGITVSGINQPETISRALDIKYDDILLFESVQATWNLLEQSAGNILREAHEAGMQVIIKETLANGRLTQRNDDRDITDHRRLLGALANEQGTTIDAVALASVLAQPWVDIALSGAATAAHLRSNLSALDFVWDDEMSDRVESLVETPDQYWAKRAKLIWN